MAHRFGTTSLRSRLVAVALVAAFVCTGCSSQNDSSDSGAASQSDAGSADAVNAEVAADAPADNAAALSERDSSAGSVPAAPGTDVLIPQQAALIKTGAVTLHSGDVGSVVDDLVIVVAGVGGEIASEDTSSNRNGVQVRSRLEVRVPVATFDSVVAKIARLGTLVAKTRSSEDVTARVADVDSRVDSAEQSIDQLRLLFAQATKLQDIIALERELSDRESELEALQAEQRSLASLTSMSTVIVNVSRPPAEPQAQNDDSEQGGFVSGVKSGWDGMVTFVVGSAHALGLVLPLGVLALLVALVVRLLVRRFMPRREDGLQPTTAASE